MIVVKRLPMLAWPFVALVGLSAGCRRTHAPIGPQPTAAPAAAAPAPAEVAPPVENAPPPPSMPSNPAAAATPSAPAAGPTLSYRTGGDGGTASTVNGDPNGPKADEMNRILKANLPKMERCLNASTEIEYGKPLQVSVQYKVGNDGKPIEVQVKGPVSATVQSCLASQVQALPYPPFSGDPVDHSFPLNYQRDWK